MRLCGCAALFAARLGAEGILPWRAEASGLAGLNDAAEKAVHGFSCQVFLVVPMIPECPDLRALCAPRTMAACRTRPDLSERGRHRDSVHECGCPQGKSMSLEATWASSRESEEIANPPNIARPSGICCRYGAIEAQWT